MPKIKCICQHCQETYELFASLAKRSKYCSRLCHNRANAISNSKRFRGKTHWNTGIKRRISEWAKIKCRFCEDIFECEPSEAKNGRKFCSKKCYDTFQAKRGESSKRIWIRESIKLYGYACEKCGKDSEKIDTHHIDRNRKNNPSDGSNWMRLCDTCHKLIHKQMNLRAPIISRAEFLSSSPSSSNLYLL